MTMLPFLLVLAVAQVPPTREDPFARLGIETELHATESGWRRPVPRCGDPAAPALARHMLDDSVHAAASAEDFVRQALLEIRPAPLLRAAAAAFGGKRPPEPRALAELDAHRFEDVLERVHRDVVRALGSGRDLDLLTPELQALTERYLQPGALDQATDSDRGPLRAALTRAAKVDQEVLAQQAIVLIQAAQALVAGGGRELASAPTRPGERGVVGGVVLDRTTPFGRLVIGGTGHNEYECGEIAVIVDLGGNDEYRGPVAAAGVSRRMSLVVDVEGDDVYRGDNDALGAATFGVGVLIDLAGNDRYEGAARCAGFGAAGVGALLDLGGDDTMTLARDSGGVGLAGIGLLLDAGSGKDITRVGARALGVGLPGGVGLFVDDGGDDARSMYDGDAAASLGCGVGIGVSRWLAGGVGVYVDVGGGDEYAGGDLVCGAGTQGGVGICVDAAGDDRYRVGELALGGGRDHGVGVFFDAAGDDEYHTRGPSLGCAFNGAVGWAEDRAGRDTYDLRGAWPGWADGGALGAFFEFAGRDHYTLVAQPVRWGESNDKAQALAVFEDRGGEVDEYEGGGVSPAPVDAEDVRQVVAGTAGQVVRVSVDR